MNSPGASSPASQSASGTTEVRAPFGGLFTLLVSEGQCVASGEVLGILEAMKMEAPITSPRSGTVTSAAAPNTHDAAQVSGGDLLVSLD